MDTHQKSHMKNLIIITALLLNAFPVFSETDKKPETINNNKNYDPELAKRVEADDYGMKSYVFIILKSGDNTSKDAEKRNKSFRGHMENIGRLVEDGKMVVAGPFGKNDKDFRGLFILNVKTIEEAQALMATDPAIKEGYLSVEMYPWYGSAALSEYLPASDKVWKVKP